jgi:hypothetical protein
MAAAQKGLDWRFSLELVSLGFTFASDKLAKRHLYGSLL